MHRFCDATKNYIAYCQGWQIDILPALPLFLFEYQSICNFFFIIIVFLFSLVRFFPLDTEDEESVGDLLLQIDSILQYGEDADVQVRDFDEPDENDERDPDM